MLGTPAAPGPTKPGPSSHRSLRPTALSIAQKAAASVTAHVPDRLSLSGLRGADFIRLIPSRGSRPRNSTTAQPWSRGAQLRHVRRSHSEVKHNKAPGTRIGGLVLLAVRATNAMPLSIRPAGKLCCDKPGGRSFLASPNFANNGFPDEISGHQPHHAKRPAHSRGYS